MLSQRSGNRAGRAVGERVARILSGTWRTEPPPVDFTQADLEFALPRLMEMNAAALVWWRIRHSPIAATLGATTTTGARLRQEYVARAVHSAHSTHLVQKYVTALRAQDIEPIVLKGWAMFSYYAEPGLRPSGDVDLAVAPETAERAIKILRELGATAVDVDVHPGLADPGHSAFIPDATWDELMRRSRQTSIGEREVRVLGHEEALQLTCVHCIRHLAARPMWLCDVAALVEACPPGFDWNRCLSKPPYTSWITSALLLAQRLLGAKLDGTPLALQTAQPALWLERDVLRRWSEPVVPLKVIHNSLWGVWSDPALWEEAVRVRIPNRLAATLSYQGALDEPWLVRYQMRSFLSQVTRFARRTLIRKHF